jgi:outer membrane lipoprotein-sorting protein
MRASGLPALSPTLVAALLVAGAVTATGSAVVAFGAPDAPTNSVVGADAADEFAAVDGVTATRVTVVERGSTTHRAVADVAFRPGTDYRRVALRDTDDRRHELLVANSTTMTLYDRDSREATQFALAPDTEPTVGERVERLFARLQLTREDAPASAPVAGVSPLSVVPHGETRPSTVTGELTVRYEGKTTVAGRTAYALELTAREGAFAQRIWVDADHFFVLKQSTTWTDGGERVTVETTYEDVSTGAIPDDTFRFGPPANATVERLDTPERSVYESATRLRAAVDVSVPRPDVPASFRLTAATETDGEIRGVGLRYANDTATVTVAKYNRTFPPRGTKVVTVADRDAGVRVGPTTSVSWNCDDYRYTVRGTGVSVDTLVAIAQSVGCQ